MSTAVLPGQMSVDEFLARPEREDGQVEELIDGEVVLSPNVKKGHNDVVSRIGRKLLPLEEQGFVVRGEVACRLSPRSLPNTDACVFRRDRWDAVDDEDFVREAPLLAIEVVSPGNRHPKLLTKADLYVRHGAEQVWLIYPRKRTVTVLSQDGGNHEVREGESLSFGGLRWDAAEFSAERSDASIASFMALGRACGAEGSMQAEALPHKRGAPIASLMASIAGRTPRRSQGAPGFFTNFGGLAVSAKSHAQR